MTFSMKRALAIFQKDYKDLSRNLFVSSTLIMPIFFAVFYSRLGDGGIDITYFVFNIAFSLVAIFVQCALIAEEREKNTLRGLMLSPASTLDILIGKSALTFITTILIVIACAFLLDYSPANLFVISYAMIVLAFFYIAVGTIFGLMTKTVMEASLVVMLPFFFFSFSPMLVVFKDSFALIGLLEYLPNVLIVDLAHQIEGGAGLGSTWVELVMLSAWTLVVFVGSIVMYNRKQTD
ncbi:MULTISPECIES: ABC transporter permease [unclassified Exiguobacterium]|uniref:ABC transporter permease n=1 Tax=unclassified Exiguobacterium TaxID=2644629 RepID=UPI00103FA236|nr:MULTISPECIES: ABC transporter permease [unclassified Exiguobacterium]TCI43086.1 ABC transporter permease [Exiguobacterium sp. SH5S32]TCI49872.1 ABC transporter permease [Exiguobacterium sp. SH1S4]TCI68107.1 ABC transporter permease [Exiguobacterium sp. SH1S1]